jgi:6,7-dimethyl-8-ribityllumazine synthase
MTRIIQGRPRGHGCRIGVACGRFNEAIVKELLAGCLNELDRHDVVNADIDIVWVPGAFELPLATRRLAATGRYDAIIALGCVIRGATAHFDYVAGPAASGIAEVSRTHDLPVIFGVLTVENIEQAWERAGTKAGNRGRDAAISALEMVDLLGQIGELGAE